MDAAENVFVNSDGHRIHSVRWNAGQADARGVALILHGGAEHSGRYVPMVTELASRGFIVVSHDHRGHGKSEGPRLFVNSFDEYVEDAIQHLQILRADFPALPVYLIGHSMGATIALCLVLDHSKDINVKGMVLVAPAFVSTQKSVPAFKVVMARLASKIYPQMQVAPIKPGWMSRDPQVLEDYKTDPLVYHGGVKARWGLAYLDMLAAVKGRFAEVQLPFLTMHGSGDNLWSCKGSELFHEEASSTDKTIQIFDGAYHQIHHESEGVGSQCIATIASWLQDRS
ncbi:hypothetical protein CAPTEDRAFT_158185 [Capitella teleta]|uniref:Serine aminopeptidase S33 domain-containing protein n=1 Tax=Capitella teleta TaxID=283909 RepID=R7TIY1_CAPTE|nr:hypothetical protein CAPTEDRAFT_158185 [Capitella teleta]|eukprot:ELT93674.1 hypothetical protein CAPTEDRAFT_158185 [Capitella teleta]